MFRMEYTNYSQLKTDEKQKIKKKKVNIFFILKQNKKNIPRKVKHITKLIHTKSFLSDHTSWICCYSSNFYFKY